MTTATTSLVAAALLLAAPCCHARLVEEKRWVSAKATDGYGHEVSRDIMVTIFYDDAAPKPWPALVLNHGRATTGSARAALGRAQYSVASRWFVEHGFIVAVPTRIGYGVTGGPDVEDTGYCAQKKYEPGYAASAAQTVTVLEYLRTWKEVAKDRAIVVGQSFGGTTAITIASMNVPGVQATINFAGTGGGDPQGHPDDPCSAWKLKRLFADYGKTSRIPTLWVYSENDHYSGPKLPREFFDGFRAAGGVGEFVQFPPNGEDGHSLFTHEPSWWQPKVLEFLRAQGFAQ
jgi:dienelactone hydrolase